MACYDATMLSTNASPPAWRIAVAFLAAPVAAAIAVAWFDSLRGELREPAGRVLSTAIAYALVGTYPPTLVLGVPAFFALRKRLRPTALNCVLVGAAVAALPWFLIGLLLPGGDSAEINGQAARIDGRTTLWGWFVVGRFVAMVAGTGAVGGAVFWLVAAARVSWWPPAR